MVKKYDYFSFKSIFKFDPHQRLGSFKLLGLPLGKWLWDKLSLSCWLRKWPDTLSCCLDVWGLLPSHGASQSQSSAQPLRQWTGDWTVHTPHRPHGMSGHVGTCRDILPAILEAQCQWWPAMVSGIIRDSLFLRCFVVIINNERLRLWDYTTLLSRKTLSEKISIRMKNIFGLIL